MAAEAVQEAVPVTSARQRARSLRLALAVGLAGRLPLIAALALAALCVLPYLIGAHGVPDGAVFRGSIRNHIDEAQFLAAIRQGAAGEWLWRDQYMVDPSPPILMYPVYLLAGRLGALAQLPAALDYALLHAVGMLALFGAVWHLGAGLSRPARGWFCAFTLGTSGLFGLDALLDWAGAPILPLDFLGGPVLSGFSMGAMTAHQALCMAGQLVALAGAVRALGPVPARQRRGALLSGAGGLLLMALSLPLLLPLACCILLGYAGWWIALGEHGLARRAARRRAALSLAAIVVPVLPFVAYYLLTFVGGPWSRGSFTRMPELYPLARVFIVTGALLPLAAWGWWATRAGNPRTARREARAARISGTGARPLAATLGIWILCALVGRELPFWQSVRFTTGLNMATGGLFCLGLLHHGASLRARLAWLAGLAGAGAALAYLLLLHELASGQARDLYSTAAEWQAVRWLAAHANARDVVLAPFEFSNVVPIEASCRLVWGHDYQTFDYAARRRQVRTFYGAAQPAPARLGALRATGAGYVVYDGHDREDGPFDPRRLPGLRPVFSSGDVAVLRLAPARR